MGTHKVTVWNENLQSSKPTNCPIPFGGPVAGTWTKVTRIKDRTESTALKRWIVRGVGTLGFIDSNPIRQRRNVTTLSVDGLRMVSIRSASRCKATAFSSPWLC